MNTTFNTLESLVHNSIDIHHQAAELYRSLENESSDERCRILLGEMAGKELEMAKLLEEFIQRTSPGILNTYMQYTLEEDPNDLVAAARAEGAATVEQIGSLGQKLHGYQINLMEGALHEVASEEALELLEDLLQLEKAEGRAFTRRADSIHDM